MSTQIIMLQLPKYNTQAGIAFLFFFFFSALNLQAQGDSLKAKIRYSGQLSAFGLFNPDLELNTWLGARYIPQLNFEKPLGKERLLDFEVSLNGSLNTGFHPFDTAQADFDLTPYRAWVRYSNKQFEIRAGLQKINFGSAVIFRPLQWFDQVDPRDPLQLTDGVTGVLFRYYFLNNSNIWLWSLIGNDVKGTEVFPTEKWLPEFGGRYQHPIKIGELGATYHFRMADLPPIVKEDNAAESRFGLDGRFDKVIGFWVEGAWIFKHKPQPAFPGLRSQVQINVGLDYTIGVGNGLGILAEQLIVGADSRVIGFDQTSTLTALNLSYPIGMFDNLGAFVYYDWTNDDPKQRTYFSLQYSRSFPKITLNAIAFWNPKNGLAQVGDDTTTNLFGGKGIQILITWKH